MKKKILQKMATVLSMVSMLVVFGSCELFEDIGILKPSEFTIMTIENNSPDAVSFYIDASAKRIDQGTVL